MNARKRLTPKRKVWTVRGLAASGTVYSSDKSTKREALALAKEWFESGSRWPGRRTVRFIEVRVYRYDLTNGVVFQGVK